MSLEDKVSVILPNYNHSLFLKSRLDSILNQTYQNFELIILDDASTDNSLEILEPYRNHDKVSHFVVNDTNSGSVFKQWVKGIRLAKGKYIWIAESDDCCSEEFLLTLLKPLQEDGNIIVSYCDSQIIDRTGQRVEDYKTQKNLFFKTSKWSHNHIADGKSELINYLLYKTTLNNTSACLFRQSALSSEDLNSHLINYKNAGDLFTYIYLGLKGNFSYTSIPLNHYRNHSGNFTKINYNNAVLHTERLQCFSYATSQLRKSGITDAQKNRIKSALKYIIKKNGFQLIKANKKEVALTFVENLRKESYFGFWLYGEYLLLCHLVDFRIPILSSLAWKIIKLKAKL